MGPSPHLGDPRTQARALLVRCLSSRCRSRSRSCLGAGAVVLLLLLLRCRRGTCFPWLLLLLLLTGFCEVGAGGGAWEMAPLIVPVEQQGW